MAKFNTATIAAALLCLVTVSIARAPPEFNDVSAAANINADPAAANNNADRAALRLPGEPAVNTEAADSNSNAGEFVTAVPLTDVAFRPINRRFHARSKLPCPHKFKLYPTEAAAAAAAIHYGNDMILPSGENSDFEEPIVRGGGKRIPGRWMRMPHHHLGQRRDEIDSDKEEAEEEEDRMKKVAFKRYDYDRFEREKRLKKLREHFRARIQQEEEDNKSKKKTNFMKGVRKFLDRYI